MTLGTKISLGFAVVLAFAGAVGGFALFTMKPVERESEIVAYSYVPRIEIAAHTERFALETGYEMRAFYYALDRKIFEKGLVNLEEVKAHVKEARDLIASRPDLADHAGQIEELDRNVQAYERMCHEVAEAADKLLAAREAVGTSGEEYLASANGYCTSMQEEMRKELGENASPERLIERSGKVDTAIELQLVGAHAIRDAWRGQAERSAELIAAAREQLANVVTKVEALMPITRQEKNRKLLQSTRDAAHSLSTTLGQIAETWAAVDEAGKRRIVAYRAVINAARTTADEDLLAARDVAAGATKSLSFASYFVMVAMGVSIGAGILIAWLITRAITRPINRIVISLSEGSALVAEASEMVNASAAQLAAASSEQASSLTETNSALDRMSSMTSTNRDNAVQANELVGRARTEAQDCDAGTARLNSAMQAINDSSSQISRIIKVIEEIAFQTNLLALNAAVEAARAGEHGKGFAVVAEEVRNLARRAAEAARETTSLIEASVGRAKEGTDVARGFGQALTGIVEHISKASDYVSSINRDSSEQAQGVDQIAQAVKQMDAVTQSIASSSEESAAAVEELSAQAGAVAETAVSLAKLVGIKADRADQSHAAQTIRANVQRRREELVDDRSGSTGGSF